MMKVPIAAPRMVSSSNGMEAISGPMAPPLATKLPNTQASRKPRPPMVSMVAQYARHRLLTRDAHVWNGWR